MLTRGEDGGRWRGQGRYNTVANPEASYEWHIADWPVIEPSPRPRLATTVRLDSVSGSMASGVVTLEALLEGETRFAAQVSGLTPGATYAIRLHAGIRTLPSASFTSLATLTADQFGRATASGPVRFRGVEDIPLVDIADGNHLIVLARAGETVAVGEIPVV